MPPLVPDNAAISTPAPTPVGSSEAGCTESEKGSLAAETTAMLGSMPIFATPMGYICRPQVVPIISGIGCSVCTTVTETWYSTCYSCTATTVSTVAGLTVTVIFTPPTNMYGTLPKLPEDNLLTFLQAPAVLRVF